MLQSPKIWFWGHNEYEFVPLGVQSKLELPVMRTPLRVTSENIWPCTIAIVNLGTIPAPFLDDGGTKGPYPDSDTATYYDIQDALSKVWSDCVYGVERQVGWAATGESIHLREEYEIFKELIVRWDALGRANALGVFMFDARSEISRAIPNDPRGISYVEIENVTRLDTQV
ncbi:hypothetical protein IMSHALPRED_006098 [Imshaugia aleurites]|uniref:Uncharacterized protein n=1 Tax=Imshaugia aleurites TaxID=172621 RepID=A0A8H3FGE0_9LECA|nr:hypothetical protein IMSHALPRED_006098 [Imshaugia aleurites]